MSGVRAFAILGCSALAGLTPLAAAALDVGAEAQALPMASPGVRAGAIAALLLGALLVAAGWLRREGALRRAAPLPAEADIDSAWLEQHVFSLPPELVGAAYDRHVAGPELAAVLARMCGESKLASRVAAGARGWNNLELWLLVERDELTGYERELVDRLFASRKTTSGDRLREEHGATGFDPASVLRPSLSEASDAALGIRPLRRWPLWLAFAAAAGGLALTARADVASIVAVLAAAAIGVFGPLGGALVFAPRFHRDAAKSAARARACLLSAGGSLVALGALIAALPSLPPLAPLGVAACGLLGAVLAARAAASRESADGVALRRNLFAARRFFASELERPEPRLRDEWLPYLIALELTSEIERWYPAYGRIETAARRQRQAPRAEPEHAAAPPWTGGAGGIGGIGPSAPWIAAAAGLTLAPRRERSSTGPLDQRLELEPA